MKKTKKRSQFKLKKGKKKISLTVRTAHPGKNQKGWKINADGKISS
jgi:hypothetical protein